jgi:hypothetical protein
MDLSLSAQLEKKFDALADAYQQAKTLILYVEELDISSRSNLQVVKELRDACDHIMRFFISRKGKPSASDLIAIQDSNLGNIDKALGHIYRATFDALDGAILSVKHSINIELLRFPPHIIADVIKDYWQIKLELNRLVMEITSIRDRKEVNENTGSLLNEYVKNVHQMSEVYRKIIYSGPVLEEAYVAAKKKEKREQKAALRIKIIGGLVVLIIGLVLGIILGKLQFNISTIQPAPTVQPAPTIQPAPTKQPAPTQQPNATK